ncbi:hypothetical protein G4228_018754 [Cervus hanglu yarkandensis]|nr:hypothetical protein G4228_018754 [Cervus hanglu yarkandensis]
MQFMLLFSRQGKLRLQKWYVPLSDKEKKKITRELVQTVLARKPKMCSFLEWRDLKIVYKRYASLYFCCAIEDQDNELITLEIIHRYVELLDKYFGSVCELDIIFNFEKAYFILDEFLLGGEVQETSKKNVLKAIEQADLLQEYAWDTNEEYLFKAMVAFSMRKVPNRETTEKNKGPSEMEDTEDKCENVITIENGIPCDPLDMKGGHINDAFVTEDERLTPL